MKYTRTQVAVYLHFGIFGEFEGIGFIIRIVHTYEDHRQAVADDVIQEHQIRFTVRIRQTDETSELVGGKFDDGIISYFHFSLAVFALQADGQVDVFVGLVVRLAGGFIEKERVGRTVQPVPVE